MPTLLQINTVINSRSTGRIAEGIGLTAISNGWQSYIAYGRDDRPSKSNKIRIGNDFDIKLHGIETRFFDKHGFGSVQATKKLITEIEKIKPNIIHLHNIHGYYINIELLFNFLSTTNIPVVWTLHDCWAITGHCAYFSFTKCDKWKTHCFNCPQKGKYPASLIKDNSFKNFEKKKFLFNSTHNLTIVTVSQWLEDLLKDSILKDVPRKVIHNGIDTDIFRPIEKTDILKKYSIDSKFIILGVANVWEERKGLNDFIKLSKKLSVDECIILVGLDTKKIKELPSNIIGIRRTESTIDLANLYSAADVFINLTWEDNFPTTNLEALACGTPVISYDTGGCNEALSTDTGFTIDQGDIEKLLICIHEIKKNKKNSYTNSCRQQAVKYFNLHDRFKEYIHLYNDILFDK